MDTSTSPLRLVEQSHPVLHAVAKPVQVFDDALTDLAGQMIHAMKEEGGIGLAAPQVGHGIRVVVLLNLSTEQPEVWVNPEIVKKWGVRWGEEGCLSLPGRRVNKRRHEHVTVKAQDLAGQWHQFIRRGLAAACVQHEIDHLNGVLMID